MGHISNGGTGVIRHISNGYMGNGDTGGSGDTGVWGTWVMRPTGAKSTGSMGMGYIGNRTQDVMGYRGVWGTWAIGYRG